MADSILRLKVESQEYDAKLKRAAEGLNRYVEGCRKVGGTLEIVEKDTLDFVKAIGQMETVSRSATGKLSEMKKAFAEFSMQYKEMTAAEKASPIGKALSQSLDQLKVRIKDTQKDLQSINQELSGGKLGQFGSIVDGIGQKLGVTGNLTEMLTSKTALMTAAIGAGTTAVVAATKAWADYNSEIAKQQQITNVTTGLKGDEADRMTSAARALSKTYNTDFREAINAANTLMTQFGKSGDEAIQLLRDGMQGMIMGDGGKLLSMIQQYAPAFRDAGVSASQLVAVIQNSEGGIFTAENMNAIVMGIKNIRLMTKQTNEALAQIGIDGMEVTKALNEGTMTIFDALKLVARQLKDVDSNSQAAGQVMQAVFGRQGAMAGTNLAKAIEGLNTNLEETKRQTGEVGESVAEINRQTEQLESNLMKVFALDGWDVMGNKIKTEVLFTLNYTLETLDNIYATIERIGDANGFTKVLSKVIELGGPLGNVYNLIRNINDLVGGGENGTPAPSGNNGGNNPKQSQQEYKNYLSKRFKNYDPNSGGGVGQDRNGVWFQVQNGKAVDLIENTPTVNPPKPKGGRGGTAASIEDRIRASYEKATDNALANADSLKHTSPFNFVSPWQQMIANRPEIAQTPTSGASTQWSPLEKLDIEIKALADAMEKAETPEEYDNYRKARDQKQKERDKFTGDSKPLKEMVDWSSQMAGGINSIVSGIEGLGIEIPEGLRSVLTGLNSIISIASGISTILIAISMKPFAGGGVVRAAQGFNGVVPGFNYSGDMIPARLNAGEVVLNKAQANSLAGFISAAEQGGGGEAVSRVSGEQIYVILSRYLRRSGRGELATWK